MTTHAEIQTRLKAAIQEAILMVGEVDGINAVALTNTDVIEALLEVIGVWASVHGFENYTPGDLAFKYAMTIRGHIERYEPLMKSGKLPLDIIPRGKIN